MTYGDFEFRPIAIMRVQGDNWENHFHLLEWADDGGEKPIKLYAVEVYDDCFPAGTRKMWCDICDVEEVYQRAEQFCKANNCWWQLKTIQQALPRG